MSASIKIACPECGKKLRTEYAVADHRQTVHGVAKLVIAPKPQAPMCPCGREAVLVGGEQIYPHRPDLFAKQFWLCQPCKAYCGCHPGGTTPLGTPADGPTRAARSAAHAAFDPIWRRGIMHRAAAYAWLSGQLGIDPKKCHIGMMTAQRARQVVAVVSAAEFKSHALSSPGAASGSTTSLTQPAAEGGRQLTGDGL